MRLCINLLLIGLLAFPFLSHGQSNLIDVVYLKNGSIIKGVITEQVPGKAIKLQTADGSLFVFEAEEILKMTREANSTTAAPSSAPNSGMLQAKSPKERDEWGNTYDQNMELARRRKNQGIGWLIGGTLVVAGGGTLFIIGSQQKFKDQGWFWAYGGLACGLSVPFLAIGGSLLSKSKMYERRAKNMKEGTAYLRPTIINTSSYNGIRVDGGLAYGVGLNIRF